jgi:hypothetical protein
VEWRGLKMKPIVYFRGSSLCLTFVSHFEGCNKALIVDFMPRRESYRSALT